jgi:isocitrate/isopropylmalate dehydrogenase
MFEPVHGSAPKYAGKDVANPLGAILTAQMMLDTLEETEAAVIVERAVREALKSGQCTRDLGGTLGTSATGDFVASQVRQGS